MRWTTEQPSHLLGGRCAVQPVQAQLADPRKSPHVGKPPAQWVILRHLPGPDRRQHSQSDDRPARPARTSARPACSDPPSAGRPRPGPSAAAGRRRSASRRTRSVHRWTRSLRMAVAAEPAHRDRLPTAAAPSSAAGTARPTTSTAGRTPRERRPSTLPRTCRSGQRRLPHAGLTRDEQCTGPACGRGLNERGHLGELVGSPRKPSLMRLRPSHHLTSFPPARDAREAVDLRVQRRNLRNRPRCRCADGWAV